MSVLVEIGPDADVDLGPIEVPQEPPRSGDSEEAQQTEPE
jgi:hypothetical protein